MPTQTDNVVLTWAGEAGKVYEVRWSVGDGEFGDWHKTTEGGVVIINDDRPCRFPCGQEISIILCFRSLYLPNSCVLSWKQGDLGRFSAKIINRTLYCEKSYAHLENSEISRHFSKKSFRRKSLHCLSLFVLRKLF